MVEPPTQPLAGVKQQAPPPPQQQPQPMVEPPPAAAKGLILVAAPPQGASWAEEQDDEQLVCQQLWAGSPIAGQQVEQTHQPAGTTQHAAHQTQPREGGS